MQLPELYITSTQYMCVAFSENKAIRFRFVTYVLSLSRVVMDSFVCIFVFFVSMCEKAFFEHQFRDSNEHQNNGNQNRKSNYLKDNTLDNTTHRSWLIMT